MHRAIIHFWVFAVMACPVQVHAIGHDSNQEFLEAVRDGDVTTAKYLLDNQADVNAARNDGTTALAWAVYNDDEGMVDLLIRSGSGGLVMSDPPIIAIVETARMKTTGIIPVLATV